ncbi:hypothetical protein VTL71DRAFT_4705 [Oculimacula yallundae]|uniref:Uncharacterized protein n=1 Tax=Oculimacula yallundae TaxID=86028 RepID=A0ABR4C2Q7_9HELO
MVKIRVTCHVIWTATLFANRIPRKLPASLGRTSPNPIPHSSHILNRIKCRLFWVGWFGYVHPSLCPLIQFPFYNPSSPSVCQFHDPS